MRCVFPYDLEGTGGSGCGTIVPHRGPDCQRRARASSVRGRVGRVSTSPDVMTAAQIRAAEERTMRDTPERVLMDRAAAAVAAAAGAVLDQRGGIAGARVVVLAGSGNNGGDALLAGALLARENAIVTAITLGSSVHARGRAALEEAGGRLVPGGDDARETAAEADLAIDGIVGIGSRPGLRPDAAAVVEALTCPVVAVDLPSGLDADSGDASATHVRADVTVTFTAPKRCLVEEPAAASAGAMVLADVGIGL